MAVTTGSPSAGRSSGGRAAREEAAVTRTLQYGYPGGAGNKYYRHSGQVTLAGPLLAVAVGGAAAVALAFAYAYADLYFPLIYLNLLLCLGFGAALGAVPGA